MQWLWVHTARRDSESVLVAWRNHKLAEIHLWHFERNYRQATALQY